MDQRTVQVACVTGRSVVEQLDALARLRIEVFREFPYLYQGTLDDERHYLEAYARDPSALVVLARSEGRIVGASTAMPLQSHGEDMCPAFTAAGIEPAAVFYFGESVLERAYRGLGLGHAFFDRREQFARERGYAWTAFCAVERPASHPLRPADYQPHDRFWTKRGYTKRPDLRVHFSWRDVGESSPSAKAMLFWTKSTSSSDAAG